MICPEGHSGAGGRMELIISFEGGQEVVVKVRADPAATVRALEDVLPFESVSNRWGDEVYFEAPFTSPLESDAREVMAVGDVAFWPDGSAMALFFGRTPASTDERPRAYSRCNMLGRVSGDVGVLRGVRPGERVRVSKAP